MIGQMRFSLGIHKLYRIKLSAAGVNFRKFLTMSTSQETSLEGNVLLCCLKYVPYLPRIINHEEKTFQFELFQKSHLTSTWNLLQKVISEGAVGFMTNEIPQSPEHLQTAVEGTDVAAVIKDITDNEQKIIGFFWVGPYNASRSVNPITHGTYILLDTNLQASGLFAHCFNFLVLFGISSGYVGLNTRTSLAYYPMIRAAVRHGTVLTCIIPLSGQMVTPGSKRQSAAEDINGFIDYRGLTKQEQLKEEQVVRRALDRPQAPKQYGYDFKPLAIQQFLGNGCSIQTTHSKDYHKIYNILVDAANGADGFGIDEYPTLDLFKTHFLHYSTLLSLVNKQGDIIGAAVVGPSRLCRGDKPELASLYIYVVKGYRSKGLGRAVSKIISNTLMERGWKGILTQVLVVKNYPFQFLERLGYQNIGYLPCSAFVKGHGWANSAVYYKDFKNCYLEPWALGYLSNISCSNL